MMADSKHFVQSHLLAADETDNDANEPSQNLMEFI